MVLKLFAYSLVTLIFASMPAFGQLRPGDPASVGMSRAGLDRVTALLETQVRQNGLGAVSILVARRGTIVLHKGFGHLSFQAGSPAVIRQSEASDV